MSCSTLNLPLDIPWKLIDVSQDMMDIEFCNGLFPHEFRSSMAIYAWEPNIEDLPEDLCDTKITYIKVSCSITGYQATEGEVLEGVTVFNNVPTESIENATGEYLACYGVLLNVAVFPKKGYFGDNREDLTLYPHITDFEPKTRDLYQTSTESGEILSASRSGISTDKSLTKTTSSETGLSASATYTSPETPAGQISATAGFTQNWGRTNSDSTSIVGDASREKRETQSTSTQISQMYNLLTSYHAGTNRATFLMLPRPHVIQPTDRRTFVQGLRMIEGMQEFVLIVARPSNMEEMCIEATLETGHFPEEFEIEEPEEEYETSQEDVWITGSVKSVLGGKREDFAKSYTISSGWVIDKSKGDSGHAGIEELENDSNDRANNSLQGYNYFTVSDASIEVDFSIKSDTVTRAEFKRKYRIYTKSENPVESSNSSTIKTPFIITTRSLCCCIKSGEHCVTISSTTSDNVHPHFPDPQPHMGNTPVVFEKDIVVPNDLVFNVDRFLPAQKFLIDKIKFTMMKYQKLPTKYPEGIGFLDTDFFNSRIKRSLPKDFLDKKIKDVDTLDEETKGRIGQDKTIKDILNLNTRQLSDVLKVNVQEVKKIRAKLFGRKLQVKK